MTPRRTTTLPAFARRDWLRQVELYFPVSPTRPHVLEALQQARALELARRPRDCWKPREEKNHE